MAFRLIEKKAALALGAEIGRGGEGVIYSVATPTGSAAKIYSKSIGSDKLEKLRVMPLLVSENLKRVCAWPTDAIANSSGSVCGFLMPRIMASADVHKLYSPKSRFVSFPNVDFRFIVHVAANVARAFGVVHSEGHVIGDVNHGHILVGHDGRVSLIDADSFQVTYNGRTYTCDLGTPLFTPPELQDQQFRGLVRQPNHDLFGLAVLLFHLLFMGRHPFSGVWLGSGEMPIERAIREGRFVYGADAARKQMRRPPGSLELMTFGPTVAAHFERAFSVSGSRPAATQWVTALKELKANLRQCLKSEAHFYPAFSGDCPWCRIEGHGVRLFGQKVETIRSDVVDIGSLWALVERIARPATDPPLPSQASWSPPTGANVPAAYLKPARKLAALTVGMAGLAGCSSLGEHGGMVVGLAGIAMAFVAWPRVSVAEKAAADAGVVACKRAWDQLLTKWQQEASIGAFDLLKSELVRVKSAFDDLPNERRRRIAKLQADRRTYQFERFLDRFRIDHAKIPGIGSGRATTLASFGIETALDINIRDISAVSGFGPALTGALITWRKEKEAQFRYNPNEPVAPSEIARVEREVAALRNRYIVLLREGVNKLGRFSKEIPSARMRLEAPLRDAWDALKLAELRRSRL